MAEIDTLPYFFPAKNPELFREDGEALQKALNNPKSAQGEVLH
jgi:hypothetical protein